MIPRSFNFQIIRRRRWPSCCPSLEMINKKVRPLISFLWLTRRPTKYSLAIAFLRMSRLKQQEARWPNLSSLDSNGLSAEPQCKESYFQTEKLRIRQPPHEKHLTLWDLLDRLGTKISGSLLRLTRESRQEGAEAEDISQFENSTCSTSSPKSKIPSMPTNLSRESYWPSLMTPQ